MTSANAPNAHNDDVPIDLPVASSSNPRSRRSQPVPPQLVTGKSVAASAPTPSPRAPGRVAVERLASNLSTRDRDVLESVRLHRFLTTRHVEALHFSDHATALGGARTTRRVLRRLAALGVLTHLERRIGGVRAGSAGFVWTVGPVGVRIGQTDAPRRWRRYEPSLRLLAHYLAIADVHVSLVEATRQKGLELLELELEPQSWRRFLGRGGEQRLLRPDLSVVTSTGEYEDHWFLEVDLGTEHPPTVIEKCRLYLDYAASGQEQTSCNVFPRVIWIVQNDARRERLVAAFRQAQLDPTPFRLVGSGELVDVLIGGAA